MLCYKIVDRKLGIGVAYKTASPAREQAPEHDAAHQCGEDPGIRRRRPLREGRRPLLRVHLHRVAIHQVRLEQGHGFEVPSISRVAFVVLQRREFRDDGDVVVHVRPADIQVLADAVAQNVGLRQRDLAEQLQAGLDGAVRRAGLPFEQDDVRERHCCLFLMMTALATALGCSEGCGRLGAQLQSCEWQLFGGAANLLLRISSSCRVVRQIGGLARELRLLFVSRKSELATLAH